ncbi:EF hand domain-containing protein [Besnoitia besnoiti]|uniref:EF hand domain-containing protein n=1 Tax=Besnoitia besnoiti TaxID=94643 RepID=A0A2A9MAH1_BESBE|nr:EF hand domain-containing protein [Besnoitia besnoiti]PFH32936.1 EF hand domain-containing protein [Besnoitia besnoiti]
MGPKPQPIFRLGNSATEAEALLTPQEIASIRHEFSFLDLDGDGWLGAEDLRRSMRSDGIHVSKAEAETCIWAVDEDGDGRLSLADVALLYARAKRGLRRGEPQRLCNYLLFRLIDTDHDGRIKPDDVYSYLCHIMDKEAANTNMNRVFGVSTLESPATGKVTPVQWLTILDTAMWEKASPITDTHEVAHEADQNAFRPFHGYPLRLRRKVSSRLNVGKLRESMNVVPNGTALLPRDAYTRNSRFVQSSWTTEHTRNRPKFAVNP